MIYPGSFESKIGFDRIKVLLEEYCTGRIGKELVRGMMFTSDPGQVTVSLDQTWEMQQLLGSSDPPVIVDSDDIVPVLDKIRVEGTFAAEDELLSLSSHLDILRALLSWFRKADNEICPTLKAMSADVKYYPAVASVIDRVIDRHGSVKDTASAKLRDIRSELASLSAQVTRKLQSVLKSARTEGIVDPDSEISVRNGRCVIPVNAYNKRKIAGLVHDQSASGKTVYIEPAEVVELNNEILGLEYEEKREIVRILVSVADMIRPYLDEMYSSAGWLGQVDFISARARLGNRLGSVRPSLTGTPHLNWNGAIHPLLFLSFQRSPGRTVVPLNMKLDEKERILVISGPNAGGKSVCLKTVGLLQYMLQCGLTIPVSEGSAAGLFNNLFIDIGDEQSIDNDLSTYSSHLMGMKFFLRNAGPDTLVLIDEFGAGTEPVIGGAIAEAILSELNRRGVYGVITTHYTNLKHFASDTPGVVNGAMAFDNHLMQPLFKLTIGGPGSSFAFEIAGRIGLPEQVLKEATDKAGRENIVYDKILRDIARDRRYWEKKRESVRRYEKRLEKLEEEYEEGLRSIKAKSREILSAAKNEAEEILSGSNRIIENAIREIRESEADRERAREARKRIEEFRQELLKRGEDQPGQHEAAGTPLKRRTRSKKMADAGGKNPPADVQVTAGTYVRMVESDSTGLVEEVRDNVATVSFGNVTIKLPIEKLLPSTKAYYDREHRRSRKAVLDWKNPATGAEFRPQLDLRGMKAEEAILKVQEFLDQAWVISYPTVRILHGKGYGILRQQIRQYLSTLGYIRSFRDAPADQGGAGITVVELDI